MSQKLVWQVLGALIVLGILAAGWFFVVQPVFSAIASDKDELASVEAQHQLIEADIRAMTELDIGELRREVAERTAQLPYAFDEAAIYRELQRIIDGTGATLVRAAITPPVAFSGVPSAAELPDDLVPANTPEALTAAEEAGLVVATASIEFNAETHAQTLDVMSRLSESPRMYLVTSGTMTMTATQRIDVELYFLPRDAADIEIIEAG